MTALPERERRARWRLVIGTEAEAACGGLAGPAVVMDRHWNVTETNAPAQAMFARLLAGAPASEAPPNVVRMMFGPLRPFVANWDAVGEALIQRVHREAVGGVVDPRTAELLEEVLALPGVPSAWRVPDFARGTLPIIPVEFARRRRGQLFFDRDDVRHAAGRHAAGDPARVLLPA
jgi:hypothetical protein